MPDTPTALLSRRLVFRLLRQIPPCKILEIGVGEGAFLSALAGRGYRGKGVDLSPEAVALTRKKVERVGDGRISVECGDFLDLFETFDLVAAFEVLEHLEDDVRGMKKVHDLLAPGGYFLFSVPAHMSRYGPTDEIFGHFRRYERRDLQQKLTLSGFEIARFWSYGYPISNWLKPLRDRLNARKPATSYAGMAERTLESGVARAVNAPDLVYRLLFNGLTLLPFYIWQEFYLDSDRGDGYLVLARRNGDRERTSQK